MPEGTIRLFERPVRPLPPSSLLRPRSTLLSSPFSTPLLKPGLLLSPWCRRCLSRYYRLQHYERDQVLGRQDEGVAFWVALYHPQHERSKGILEGGFDGETDEN